MTRKLPRGMARFAAVSSMLLVAATGVVTVVAQEMEPLPDDTSEEPTEPAIDETTSDAAVPDPGELPPSDPTDNQVTSPQAKADWEIFAQSTAFSEAEQKFDVLDCPPGLYADKACTDPAPGVNPYKPAFKLFSDQAEKDRYIYIPENAKIDTTDPNYWKFPAKTRLYKTFIKNGKRIETRKIEKDASGTWSFETYAWFPDQRHVRRCWSVAVVEEAAA